MDMARDRCGQFSPFQIGRPSQDNQLWSLGRKERDAGRDVPARGRQQLGGLLGVGSATCTASQGVTSSCRAQGQEQWQGAQSVGLWGKVEIRIEDGVAQV
jgi:hypothetical protein